MLRLGTLACCTPTGSRWCVARRASPAVEGCCLPRNRTSGIPRTTTQDVEIGGVAIPAALAGDPGAGGANRDPRFLADGDRLGRVTGTPRGVARPRGAPLPGRAAGAWNAAAFPRSCALWAGAGRAIRSRVPRLPLHLRAAVLPVTWGKPLRSGRTATCIGAGMCVVNRGGSSTRATTALSSSWRSRCHPSTPTRPRGRWRPARRAPCVGSTPDHVLGALLPFARGGPVR